MTNFFNLTRAEASLFENYSSKGYNDVITALILADEKVMSAILKTKGEWTRTKLNEVKALINLEISKSYGGLFEAMQSESVGTAQIVMGASIGNINAELPKGAINFLINSKRDIQGYGFKELFDLTSDNHARQLRVLLASGVSQGHTAEQIVRDYGIKSDKLSKGQLRSNIFTNISDSRDAGRYEAYKELEKETGNYCYIYDATLDSNTTQYCRVHDQRVYRKPIEDITGEIKVHFNCRSVFRPCPISDKSETRASQIGEVKEQPYESWFNQQSDELKKSTLTNRRYQDYLDKKYKVKGLHDLNKAVPINTAKRELNKYSDTE